MGINKNKMIANRNLRYKMYTGMNYILFHLLVLTCVYERDNRQLHLHSFRHI